MERTAILAHRKGEDHSYLTTIAIAFAIAICVISISLRILARKRHNIALGADDATIVVGAVQFPQIF